MSDLDSKNIEVDLSKLHEYRKLLYSFQRVTNKISQTRAKICNLFPIPETSVQVWSTDKGTASFKNLIHCTSVWTCPICSLKIRARRREELDVVMEGLKSDGYSFVFLTLTRQHSKETDSDMIRKVIKSVNESYRDITGKRRIKNVKKFFDLHYIKTLEVTYSKINGFHPHLHIILALKVEEGVDKESTCLDVSDIFIEEWLKMVDGSEKNQVAKYVFDKDYESELNDYITKSNLSFELTNPYQAKEQGLHINPLSIPSMIHAKNYKYYGYSELVKVFNQYEVAIKSSRYMTFSRGLKKKYMMDEVTDTEICHDDSMFVSMLLDIERNAWLKILKHGLRAEFLNLVDRFLQGGELGSCVKDMVYDGFQFVLSEQNVLSVKKL